MAGPIDTVESFLRARNFVVDKVQHPLDDYGSSSTRILRDGVVRRRLRRRPLGPANFIIDLVVTFLLAVKFNAPVAIADTNLDAFAVLVARRLLHRPVRVIYLACDYSDQRFGGAPLLNAAYALVENCCLRWSDLVVSNTRRAAVKRLARGLPESRSLVIPNAVLIEQPPVARPLDRSAFVYVGSVTPEHGLLDLLDVLAPVMSRLLLIGDGPEWEAVIERCAVRGISVQPHRKVPRTEVLRLLWGFDGWGLAPYNSSESWTHYCSPMKVNEYVASGVPVVMSDVPEIAAYVKEQRLGVVYSDLSASRLADAISAFDERGFNDRAGDFQRAFAADRLYVQLEIGDSAPLD